VVCLDDSGPEDLSELCGNFLCGGYKLESGVQVGTCTNRWYDKLQIIVCSNGEAGVNFEHTGVDGHTVLRYAADVYTELVLLFAKVSPKISAESRRSILRPHPYSKQRCLLSPNPTKAPISIQKKKSTLPQRN
jgi:hypothetical protein